MESLGRKRSRPRRRLGRHRWVIDTTFAWFTGYRRLTTRYVRSARLYCAFATIATDPHLPPALPQIHRLRHALRRISVSTTRR